MRNGSKTSAPNGQERTVTPHPEIGVGDLPTAGAEAVCTTRKPANSGLLIAIDDHTYGHGLVARFNPVQIVWTSP